MGKRSPLRLYLYLVLGAVWLVVLAAALLGAFANWDWAYYDYLFQLRGPQNPGRRVVIVAIDDHSIHRLGRPPWPRNVYAKLLPHLSEAKVVGFDLLFDAPTPPAEDAAFAPAIAAQGRVVLATAFGFTGRGNHPVETMEWPRPTLLAAAAQTGFVNMPTDPDNVVRHVVPFDLSYFGRPYPSFALAVAMESLGLNPGNLHYASGRLTAGSLSIPVDGRGQTLINFWGPGGTFPTYSLADVLGGRIPAATFKGKIVLIGPTDPADHDYFSTPFTRGNLVAQNALPTNGVEVHANAVLSYLTSRYFHRAGWPLGLGLAVLAGLLAALATFRLRPGTGFAAFAGILAGVAVTPAALWFGTRYYVGPSAPLVLTAATYTTGTLFNFIQAELDKRHVRDLFGRYVSRDVVETILHNPEAIALGGERREVTLLFSDIRSFTAFSESKPPEEVVGKLNRYLTAMTEALFHHGGTLDKYMGDGIMAIFGAPIPQDDHARRAVDTALEMLERLAELNRQWETEGIPPFRIGIGIHTGPVLVGNVGSLERLEYTAIGATVNLASRLESLTKEHKVALILSAATFQALPPEERERHVFRELGQTEVRGMTETVGIFTVET